jgi:CRISPR/Cas system-associated protein endoribonuclease Cas2
MAQFSVYARPSCIADQVETRVRRLKLNVLIRGEVRSLMIMDAQWPSMIVMGGRQRAEAEKMPTQR